MAATETNFFITEAQLNVFVENTEKASATIMNADGVTIKKIALLHGNNTIDIRTFSNKNYSIKIIIDNNVSVEKI